MESTQKHQLPSIETLFKQSWNLFKQSFVKLLLLYLIVIGVYLAVAFIIGIVVAVFGVSLALSNPASILTTLSNPAVLSVGGIIAILIMIGLIYLGVLVQIAMLKVVFSGDKDLSINNIIKESRPLVLPVFLVNLLTGLLSLGGFILLIIPGIVISLLFSFAQYEVIFNHKRGVEALRRGFALVATDFWGVFGRILLFAVLSLLVTGLTTSMGGRGPGPFFSIVLSTLVSWFGLAYGLTIYKELLNAHPHLAGKNIKGIVSVSIVGLLIFVLLLTLGINALVQYRDTIFAPGQMNNTRNWDAGNETGRAPLRSKGFRFEEGQTAPQAPENKMIPPQYPEEI